MNMLCLWTPKWRPQGGRQKLRCSMDRMWGFQEYRNSNGQQRCNIWLNQSNVSMHTITDPIETDGIAHEGAAGEREMRQTGTHTMVMVLPGSPDSSFLLQHLPFPFSYQISILSVTICRCHTNQWPRANLIAGCPSQTARHHTLTFKEKDPNRWLAPNTNNCIKPRNKVKKGSTLPFHEQQKQLQAVAQQTASRTSAVAPLLEAVMGSTGRLNINQVISQVKSLL